MSWESGSWSFGVMLHGWMEGRWIGFIPPSFLRFIGFQKLDFDMLELVDACMGMTGLWNADLDSGLGSGSKPRVADRYPLRQVLSLSISGWVLLGVGFGVIIPLGVLA